MRYVLTLTIGLLAAIGATATTASAHDYHRSHHAVESKQPSSHHKARRRFQRRIHARAHRKAGYRHHSRYQAHRHQSRNRHRSRYVIVFSRDGVFRIARRYR